MSRGKYTKGPWVFEARSYKCIVSKPGEGYITRDVCRMDGSTMSALAQEANARLIAAAPELLDALERLADLYDTDEGCRSLPEYREARAAIAKAKGEAV